MNPSDILFQTMSSMTGGLINDLTTAMIAMFTLTFIVMGFDYLKDSFELFIANRNSARDQSESYEKYKQRRQQSELFSNTYEAEKGFVGPSPQKNSPHRDGVYF